ncbi:MAG: T9SS type A sorting domain-containing protein [Phycisphaerales bacterium]|nr:T9SS type A sorting domain-containing protein [Phycisphaerales bacterium]
MHATPFVLRRSALGHAGRGLLLAAALAASPTAGAATLERPTFSGGALVTSGGSFSLLGTVGEAGVVGDAAAGNYRLSLGFWGGGLPSIATFVPGPIPAPSAFRNGLLPNEPNPFRSGTDIVFRAAAPAPVRIEIYDVTGRNVRSLLQQVPAPGEHRLRWDGRDHAHRVVGNGVYFYRLSIGDWSETRKMLRVR